MTIATPSLTPIATRLKAEVTALRAVETSFAVTPELRIASPAAIIIPSGAQYGPNQTAPIVSQERRGFFSVVLFLSKAGASGEHALAGFEDHRDAILDALVGWRSDEKTTAIEAVSERLLNFDAQRHTLIYELRFAHKSHIRAMPGA